MAGPVEPDVASQIGDVLINVHEGVRQYGRRGVQTADHEVARLSDLGVLENSMCEHARHRLTRLTSVPQIPAEATDSRTPAPSGSSASMTRIPLSVFITACMFRTPWISDDVRIHRLGKRYRSDRDNAIHLRICPARKSFSLRLVLVLVGGGHVSESKIRVEAGPRDPALLDGTDHIDYRGVQSFTLGGGEVAEARHSRKERLEFGKK